MENEDIIDDYAGRSEGLGLNGTSIAYMKETAKWAKFLSIVGFVFIGLMVIVALFAGSMIASFSELGAGGGGVITVIYLLMALLYFFPTLYLYQYSDNTLKGIQYDDEQLLTEGFGKMKSVFKFYGIMMAIVLGIYALFFVIAILGGMAASF